MSEGRANDHQVGPVREVYTHGYGAKHLQELQARDAAHEATFFLPYLRPGISLLDCGCGPGSITLGLAERVAPGKVIGIDVEPQQIDAARSLAAQRGVTNVDFQVANVYELPFPDASFDAVFAHSLLEHLREPTKALREMRRVLKPGGIAGTRDVDFASAIFAPRTPLVDEFYNLFLRFRRYYGFDPTFARSQRQALLAAGFERTAGSASVVFHGTPESLRWRLRFWDELISRSEFIDAIFGQGWIDRPHWEAIVTELRAWHDRPDALVVWVRCEAVGWAPGASTDR
jgi:ubiquinone/menaquinone biosynthesis C-methylase UbiE